MSAKSNTVMDSIKWNYGHQDLFYLPQWQTGSRIDEFHVIYRLAYVSFYVVTFVTGFCLEVDIPITLQIIYASCYYTCWHFIMCTVSSVMSLVCVFKEYMKQRRSNIKDEDIIERERSVFCKVQWIAMSIVTDSSIALCVGYFTLVHSRGFPYFAKTAILHLWVPILVIMDFMICSVPAKLVHGYASLAVAVIYALFTYIYYVCGGLSIYGDHYLYKILDYKENPGTAVIALVSCLACMVMGRVVVYLLFLLRHKIYWRYYVLATNPSEVTRYVYEISK
ncbi:protein rolling stone-like [Anoplophora glabripennis]|uniref:protein rolling stone-like n=1 Tax=Anoplophora glabripennis TaxID=217634 RepID=UPI000873DE4C|nr:protein rolling stone-like [Anoplophora glabripennis]